MRLLPILAFAFVPCMSSCHTVRHRSGPLADPEPVAAAATGAGTYAHDVFFWLVDEARADALVAGCQTLAAIPGVTRLTVGARDTTQVRDVNEQTFDVALHVEFDSVQSYAAYGPHPLHQALIEEFGADFEKVQVYDSVLAR